jgi:hypothetical protein
MDWDGMSEEDLLVHVLYLRSSEEKLVAAAAAEEAKTNSGGEGEVAPTTDCRVKVQRLAARSCTAPAESFSTEDFCPTTFKRDSPLVQVPPPAYWIGLGRPPPAPNWLLQFVIGIGHLPRPLPAPNWLWIHPFHHHFPSYFNNLLRREKRIGVVEIIFTIYFGGTSLKMKGTILELLSSSADLEHLINLFRSMRSLLWVLLVFQLTSVFVYLGCLRSSSSSIVETWGGYRYTRLRYSRSTFRYLECVYLIVSQFPTMIN